MSNITTNPSATKHKIVWSDVGMQVLLITIGLLIAMPIIIALLTSFKSLQDISANPTAIFPREWSFENYQRAWTATPFGRYLFNSVIQSGVIVIAQVIFSIMAAFAFTFLDFPGRNVLFNVMLGSLMIPFQLTFIPNFVLISEWGLANTYAGLTLPFLASAFGVFMLRQFFMTLPPELRDAAVIDGANNFRFLWQIVVPLSSGAISAFGIFAFLGAWSQYLWPLIITNDSSMRTVQIGIRYFLFDQERGTDWGALMAGAVIVLLPTLLLFLIAQRQLVKGIAMSGLKG